MASVDRREAWLFGLAFAFLSLATIALLVAPAVRAGSWQPEGGLRWQPLLFLPLWLVAALLVRYQARLAIPQRDPVLLPLGFFLAGWGVLLVTRLSPSLGTRQAAWFIVGVALVVGLLRLRGEARWLRRYRYLWLAGGLTLTAVTLIFGTNPAGGAERLWLGCCGFYFQPSELLRLLLLVYLAAFLSDRMAFGWGTRRPEWLSALVPLFIVWGIAFGLLLVQRDLGTGTLFVALLAIMLYLTTGRWQVLPLALILAVVGSLVGYQLFDVVRVRFHAWLNPWSDPTGGAYQIVQGLIAIASGGLIGRGPGVGSPTVVPIAVSDFIFAAVGEEWGLAGGLALIALYALLVQRGLRAAMANGDPFRSILAAGISAAFGLQTTIILGGVLRLLPVTGITLPFISYGGSSLVTSMIGLGFVVLFSQRRETSSLRQPMMRLHNAFLIGWVALALALGWWAIVRAPILTARTDNPRRMLAERVNPRGKILDRSGVILADRVGEPGNLARSYPLAQDAAAVVGYDSPRYAQAGIERSMDDWLRGERGHDAWTTWWAHLTQGTPPPGLDVRLTLDAKLQSFVAAELAAYRGSVVVLESGTGNVLALASSPSFDPNRLDQDWEALIARDDAPLLNRATQGLYQPGAALGVFVAAWALDQGQISLEAPVASLTDPLPVDGVQVNCALDPLPSGLPSDLRTALRYGCPSPLAALGPILGTSGLSQMLTAFGFLERPTTDLETAAPAETPTAVDEASLRLEAAGQGGFNITPLQMARALAALRAGGNLPQPRFVDATRLPSGAWQVLGGPPGLRQAVSAHTADTMLRSMTAPGDSFAGVVATAIAGPDRRPLHWFLGATAADQPGRVVVVVLEDGVAADAWRIGVQALSAPP